MNVGAFVARRQDEWQALEGLVAEARGRTGRLDANDIRRLGSLYRGAAADLALARQRFRGDPVVARLEVLVGRSRNAVYAAPARRESVRTFVTTVYWQRILERPVPLLVSAALLLGPAVLGTVWAHRAPSEAARVVPGVYAGVTEPRPDGADLGLGAEESAAASTAIFTNNIRVSFLALVGGLTVGLLTAFSLLYNGLLLGVVVGLAFGSGNGSVTTQLLVPHGVLELSCIVVAGAAGLRVAWAIVAPGTIPRAVAIPAAARNAAEVALGTAPWLVVAGFVEGFVTPAGLGPFGANLVGGSLGAVYWTLCFWRGRTPLTGAPEPSS